MLCSVVGLFLWPARRPGTRYQTTCEICHVPLTVFAGAWKLFCSRFTSVHSALEALRLCAISLTQQREKFFKHTVAPLSENQQTTNNIITQPPAPQTSESPEREQAQLSKQRSKNTDRSSRETIHNASLYQHLSIHCGLLTNLNVITRMTDILISPQDAVTHQEGARAALKLVVPNFCNVLISE